MVSSLEARLQAELDDLQATGLTRRRRLLTSPCDRIVTVDGENKLNFASNDYLGLANHPLLIQATQQTAQDWGAGSGASHLVSGHLQPHEHAEIALAELTGFERTLTFSTGYLANLAVAPTLAGRGDAIFADKLNHASLIDAMQLAKANGAEVHRYPHNDTAALSRQLATSQAKTKVILTDAVFSMDGDLAPLETLQALAVEHQAWLVIDDAHGFGVLGQQGAGSLSHLGISPASNILLMGTLGKAAGVGGAFVAGSQLAMEYLLQKARSYIFTTAAPPAIAGAIQASVSLIREGQHLRNTLQNHIQNLQAAAQDLPWQLLPSSTAIQPLIIGDNHEALRISQSLWAQGIWAPAIRPPAVPKGTARLRISLSAAHQAEDIDRLVSSLKALV